MTRFGRWRVVVVVSCLGFASACASSGARPGPAPFPRSAGSSPAARVTPRVAAPALTPAQAVVESALSLRGTPYRFGGTTPESGFDCSGFVEYVMGLHAVSLPRLVAEQFTAGEPVARNRLQPGDLVFFSTTGRGPTHVGIVTDVAQAEFVHAPADGSRVRVDRFDAEYWRSRWVGARRVF